MFIFEARIKDVSVLGGVCLRHLGDLLCTKGSVAESMQPAMVSVGRRESIFQAQSSVCLHGIRLPKGQTATEERSKVGHGGMSQLKAEV